MDHLDRSRDDFTLFRRNRRFLRAGVTLVVTLFALTLAALFAPRSGKLLAWASEVFEQLFA